MAFRMRDEQNMWEENLFHCCVFHLHVVIRCRYIYEVRQEQGIKRLLKVVDGRPIELATRSDGGKVIVSMGLLLWLFFRLLEQCVVYASHRTCNEQNRCESHLQRFTPASYPTRTSVFSDSIWHFGTAVEEHLQFAGWFSCNRNGRVFDHWR